MPKTKEEQETKDTKCIKCGKDKGDCKCTKRADGTLIF